MVYDFVYINSGRMEWKNTFFVTSSNLVVIKFLKMKNLALGWEGGGVGGLSNCLSDLVIYID